MICFSSDESPVNNSKIGKLHHTHTKSGFHELWGLHVDIMHSLTLTLFSYTWRMSLERQITNHFTKSMSLQLKLHLYTPHPTHTHTCSLFFQCPLARPSLWTLWPALWPQLWWFWVEPAWPSVCCRSTSFNILASQRPRMFGTSLSECLSTCRRQVNDKQLLQWTRAMLVSQVHENMKMKGDLTFGLDHVRTGPWTLMSRSFRQVSTFTLSSFSAFLKKYSKLMWETRMSFSPTFKNIRVVDRILLWWRMRIFWSSASVQ